MTKWFERLFDRLGIDTLHEFMLPSLSFLIFWFYVAVCIYIFQLDAIKPEHMIIFGSASAMVGIVIGYWFKADSVIASKKNEVEKEE